MKRPANEAKVLERIKDWRAICPDIAIRSTFVVGFPGETEDDFHYLLDWLDEAQLDRVGAFRFEPVEGAAANALPDPVPEEVKEERYARLMELTARDLRRQARGQDRPHADVIIDAVGEPDEDGDGATGRSKADAPEIDGEVFLRDVPATLKPGDIVEAIDRGCRRARPVRGARLTDITDGRPPSSRGGEGHTVDHMDHSPEREKPSLAKSVAITAARRRRSTV